MECDAIDCCGFVNLCFWFVLSCGCELTTPDPSALILSVKFCNEETGTNLHTQERNKRFSMPSVMFCFCHVLTGAISIITIAGTRAHVHLFCDDVWRLKRVPNEPKKHGHIHIVHHDELLLLWEWVVSHSWRTHQVQPSGV
jgi:hypothetical protein